MGMEIHRTSLGMQDTDIAYIGSKILFVGSKLIQCTGGRMIKSIVKKPLIAVYDRI